MSRMQGAAPGRPVVRWFAALRRHAAARLACLVVGIAGICLSTDVLGQESGPRGVAVEAADGRHGSQPVVHLFCIGAENYAHVRHLAYCNEDVNAVIAALRRRTDLRATRIRRITDEPGAVHQPTREGIEQGLAEFLERVRRQDVVIVFFSGHGFRDAQGLTYLAPVECDLDRLRTTAVPLSTIREQLEKCQASGKVFLIDACHAGSTKGAREDPTAQDLEPDLKEAEGVFTIASCQANEKSLEWDDKQLGLFTYWMKLGLEGGADYDGDGAIRADELFRFVRRFVMLTSKEHFDRQQTPALIVEPSRWDVPTIARLQPEPLTRTLPRMAELLHEVARYSDVKKLGVLEVTHMLTGRELLRGELGMLGRTAAEKIEQYLLDHGDGSYVVADQRQVRQALNQLTVDDIGNPHALRRIPARIPELDALVVGSFRRTASNRLLLNCKLLRLADGALLASISGAVYLDSGDREIDANVFGLLGGSATVIELGEPPSWQSYFRWLQKRATQVPPPIDPRFRNNFELEIISGGKAKPFFRNDNRICVGLRPKENYAIRIKNKTEAPVLVRVFIDGLNVLGARRDVLDKSWPWVFPPGGELILDSWHRPLPTTENGYQRFGGGKFVAVSPGRSLAACQGFGQDVGQITVMFNAASTDRRLPPLGTGEGPEEILKKYPVPDEKFQLGELLSVVTVHYVDESFLEPPTYQPVVPATP